MVSMRIAFYLNGSISSISDSAGLVHLKIAVTRNLFDLGRYERFETAARLTWSDEATLITQLIVDFPNCSDKVGAAVFVRLIQQVLRVLIVDLVAFECVVLLVFVWILHHRGLLWDVDPRAWGVFSALNSSSVNRVLQFWALKSVYHHTVVSAHLIILGEQIRRPGFHLGRLLHGEILFVQWLSELCSLSRTLFHS